MAREACGALCCLLSMLEERERKKSAYICILCARVLNARLSKYIYTRRPTDACFLRYILCRFRFYVKVFEEQLMVNVGGIEIAEKNVFSLCKQARKLFVILTTLRVDC